LIAAQPAIQQRAGGVGVQPFQPGRGGQVAYPADPAAARLCNDYPDSGVYVIQLRLHPRTQIAWLKAALTAAQALGHREAEGVHLGNLGLLLLLEQQGKLPRAVELMQVTVDFYSSIGHPRAEGLAAVVAEIRQKLK